MGVHANSVQLLKNDQPCSPEGLAKNNMAGVNVIGDRGCAQTPSLAALTNYGWPVVNSSVFINGVSKSLKIKLDCLYIGMDVKKEITICCRVEIESLNTIQCAWKN
jgi:hypothetical protein